MKPDRFDRAYELRAAILRHANLVADCSSAEISIVCNIAVEAAGRALRAMVEEGTLSKRGTGKHIRYTALKTETTPAHVLRDRMIERKSASMKIAHQRSDEKPPKPCEPWRTRSCDVRPPYTSSPYKDQGGQGNLRREVCIQSVMA